jgi:hypothetical protein
VHAAKVLETICYQLLKPEFAERNQSRFDVDSIDFVFWLEVGMKVLTGQERDQFLLDLLKQSSKDGLLSKRFVKEAVSGPKDEEWSEEERQRIVQMLLERTFYCIKLEP